MLVLILACSALFAHAQVAVENAIGAPELTFSGDVKADMIDRQGVVTIPDASTNGVVADVGLPPAWPHPYSGWDIENIVVSYDYQKDVLSIGIDCYAVCGDADGNGDPGDSPIALIARGGVDVPNMGRSESFAVALDLGRGPADAPLDGKFDVVLGYPATQPADSDNFPCGALDNSCFGVYLYEGETTSDPYNRFLYTTSSGVLPHPSVDHNPVTSIEKPDLEWSIPQFNELRRKLSIAPIDSTGVSPWAIQLRAFAGSFQDDGIGEDFLPNDADYVRIDWPCQAIDACGVCGGDGSTCADCAGVPNGSTVYDDCDVCAGDNSSCTDCQGVLFGTSAYDKCDVCDGTGNCTDPPAVVPPQDKNAEPLVAVEVDCPNGQLCDDDFGNPCEFRAGDVWHGTYGVTARAPHQSGRNVTIALGEHNYAALQSGNTVVYSRWIISDDFVTVADLASYPAGSKCPSNQLAKYTVVWYNKCTVARLIQKKDPCGRRGGLFRDGSEPWELRKQPCQEKVECVPDMTQNVLTHGKFHSGSEFSLMLFGNLMIESSEEYGTVFSMTQWDPAQNASILHKIGGQYEPKDACEPGASAVTTLSTKSGNGPRGCAGWETAVKDTQCRHLLRWDRVSIKANEFQCHQKPAPTQAPKKKETLPRIVFDSDRHYHADPLKYMHVGVKMRERFHHDHHRTHEKHHHASTDDDDAVEDDDAVYTELPEAEQQFAEPAEVPDAFAPGAGGFC